MADEEVYVRRSVKDLAAGLNKGEVGRVPVTSKPAKPLPNVRPKFTPSMAAEAPASVDTNGAGNLPAGDGSKPPPRLPSRQPSGNGVAEVVAPALPTRRDTGSEAPRPSLPARRPTDKPSLPMRRPSEASTIASVSSITSNSDSLSVPKLPQRRPTDGSSLPERRKSQASISSFQSTDSTGRKKMAPEYDPSTLPPLPPKRTATQESETPLRSPSLHTRRTSGTVVPLPSRTPKLPERSPRLPERSESTPPTQPPRRLPPVDVPKVSKVVRPAPASNGINNSAANGTPPPVPLASRPDLSKILATKPKFDPSAQPATNGTAVKSTECLTCHDFSGPDNHAARFPRHTVRSVDELARDLTRPFYSPTDKARAIFTWMHHNIAYDCNAFFNKNIKSVTPNDVLKSGLAVCSGYAGMYADICLKAGLECVVIGGHGKGYGYTALKPGEPVPPESQGHAWNAVKIDIGGPYGNGQMYWKLCDPCWGAGHVGDDKQYHKNFTPAEFCKSNEDFGRTHFPEDKTKFFRADGRVVPWAEYYIGDAGAEPVEAFAKFEEGISNANFLPKQKKISVDPSAHAASNGMIRFQFQRVCEHWKPEIHGRGKDYVYALAVHEGKWLPFQSNGFFWWLDVHVSKLGPRGETLNLWYIDTINGQDARGVTAQEYVEKQGRAGMSFQCVARWDLV